MQYLIHQLLENSTHKYPRKTALSHGRIKLNYAQVLARVEQLTARLMSLDIHKGDRIGVYLDKSIEEVISIFSISKTGAILVIINPSLRATQVTHILKESGAKILITKEPMIVEMRSQIRKQKDLSFIVEMGGQVFRALRSERSGFKQFKSQPRLQQSLPRIDRDDLAAIIYTSGSTGLPKGVMLSHRNITLSAYTSVKHLRNRKDDRLLGLLPLSFDYGLNQLMSSFAVGGTYMIKKYLFAHDVLETIKKQRVTGLAGIPSILIPLVEAASEKKSSYKSLRYIANSGGRLPISVAQQLLKAFPKIKFYSMYGFTEAFRSTFLSPTQIKKRPDSIGKAVPNANVYILNKKGKKCKSGEIGELVHGGALVSQGYWGRPSETRKKFKQDPFKKGSRKKVCFSGDFVKKDAAGYLYFVGRKDHMLKCSGFRVSVDEVETILHQHKYVKQAVVWGVPDKVLGHRLKVALTVIGKRVLSERVMMSYCLKNMPSYMVPQSIKIVKRLPLTTHGKVNRSELMKLVS